MSLAVDKVTWGCYSNGHLDAGQKRLLFTLPTPARPATCQIVRFSFMPGHGKEVNRCTQPLWVSYSVAFRIDIDSYL